MKISKAVNSSSDQSKKIQFNRSGIDIIIRDQFNLWKVEFYLFLLHSKVFNIFEIDRNFHKIWLTNYISSENCNFKKLLCIKVFVFFECGSYFLCSHFDVDRPGIQVSHPSESPYLIIMHCKVNDVLSVSCFNMTRHLLIGVKILNSFQGISRLDFDDYFLLRK